MKTSIKNIIDFRGLPVEVITPKYSAFVVTVFENGIRINHGDTVIAQQHIHRHLDDREAEFNVAMDSAYRKAMLWIVFNEPFSLSALYRHIVRHYTDGKVEPKVWNANSDYVTGIVNMTTRANDVNVVMTGETELNDKTPMEFDLTLRHDGDVFTANGNNFHIEMVHVMTGLPILGAEVN